VLCVYCSRHRAPYLKRLVRLSVATVAILNLPDNGCARYFFSERDTSNKTCAVSFTSLRAFMISGQPRFV
jgi:hypothetical protein